MKSTRYSDDPYVNAIIEERMARELRYGQTRWTEVWLACIMVSIGGVLLAGGQTFFSIEGWRVIAGFVSEPTAGWLALLSGMARLAALYVNGAHRRTPIVRILGCAVGFLFFGALALGFFLAPGPPRVSPYLFAILAIAELHSSGRASRDAFAFDSFGTEQRRRERERNSGDD